MIPLNKTHHHRHNPLQHFLISQNTPPRSPPRRSSPPLSLPLRRRTGPPRRLGSPIFRVPCFAKTTIKASELEEDGTVDLSERGEVYRKTLALVECSMFASLTGLVYFLSNSLAIENYFGCFFSLPIVISSMRWGTSAGRKTMVATTMLLLVLSGPVKALTYLLKHGLAGFVMGALWRSGADWRLSVFLCTIVRALGAVGYVLISSFLIQENILALITINIHASLTFLFTASGVYAVPSMNAIYTLFGILVFLNSGSFIFLLHLLYAVFLTRLGMRDSLRMPQWLEKAI